MASEDSSHLAYEIVQVAAVAVKWLESRGWDQETALCAVRAERRAQDKKWGPVQPGVDGDRMMSILTEEVGEVAKELNDALGQ